MTGAARPTRIHQGFEAHAAAAPHDLALTCAATHVTYGELDARANQLAHLLCAHLSGHEPTVAAHLTRGPLLPLALLAVHKAGATWAPLDPAHPPERRRAVIADAAPAMLLTEPGLEAPDQLEPLLLPPFEALDALLAPYPTSPPPLSPDRRERAYLMYTSGSTGRPKGVEIEHEALLARYELSPYRALLGPGDVLAAITAVSWNPSIFEMLFPLARGATIALATQDELVDPRRLMRFLETHRVTFMRAVPSLWQALLDAGWAGKADLTIVCHGEQLPARLAERLAGLGARLSDTWGSTEATLFCEVAPTSDGRRLLRPPAHVPDGSLLVLGPDLAPAPPGSAGELCLAGPVLARGYHDDPDLTAARFPTLPDGRRAYRTGDLGRVEPDGAVALLGRVDHQMKIRGQRIEPGEIEAALLAEPGIEEAVVALRGDPEPRLCAYLRLAPGHTLDAPALRAALRARLTEAMVPAELVALPAFPLTAQGKVDRKALPWPLPAAPAAIATAPPASSSPREALLLALMGDALGHPLGPDDDFFDHGGHSLAAARVATRLDLEHGLDLPLSAFFAARTARALARLLPARPRALAAPIPRLADRSRGALSFAQERLWFLAELAPADTSYNLPSATRLRGPLDLDALRAALDALVARHEVLRTSYHRGPDGRPYQAPRLSAPLALPLVDHASAPPQEVLAATRAALLADARRPFDLAQPPPLRASLHRIGERDHVLGLNLHHIASDGWSKAVLRRDLAALYRAARGLGPPPPALPLQVLDHAAWQRAALDEATIARELAYWREQLAGLEPLALPTDVTRPRSPGREGARVRRLLPPPIVNGLRRLASERGASLFMVLLAAFDALVFRLTGQTDFAVGAPVAGRDHPALEGLVGFFVNTLVLRARPSHHLPFGAFLDQIQNTTLAALEHQRLPFERLVSELQPEREDGAAPLVQAVVALQNTPWEDLELPDLAVEPLELAEPQVRFDLELHAWERADGLEAHLVYDLALWSEARAEALLAELVVLLEGVVAAPETPLGQLPILPRAEREALDALSRGAPLRRPPPERAVPTQVLARAEAHPGRLALVDATRRLTWAELAREATGLAHALRRRALEGSLIGVCIPRGAATVIAELAVMLAGAAYLPLDPDHPEARLVSLVTAAGAAAVLTTAALAPRFGARALALDELAGAPPEVPLPEPRLDALAYVITTSGSTGRPHVVEIDHRALLRFASWYAEHHELGPGDRVSRLASPSFDATVLETWPALLAGATLCLPDPDTRLVPHRLVGWLEREAVTVAFLPTPLCELALAERALDPPRLPALRVLATGGDRLTRRPPAGVRWTLHNHYGPTEATVSAVSCEVPASADTTRIPIGRPAAHVVARVLDAEGGLVPFAVPGELHLGGPALARGYRDEPELTASRFVPDPSGPPGARLYRTGDRVRVRMDGQLEYLGRIDQQVKIRGVRVEPGEVDRALATHPEVAEALTVCPEEDGPKRLVSYVVSRRGVEPARDHALAHAHVAAWRELYEREYASAPPDHDAERNLVGWNSSYTGLPIPEDEMLAWVDHTVELVRSFGPRRVLELGCGTGLLLHPLAREVDRYAAIDLSPHAIAGIRAHLARKPPRAEVTLAVGAAHDLGWLPGGETFDTLLLSSVVQYFPSVDYLVEVLHAAMPHLAEGARVVLADLRNHDLARTFHLAVARHRTGPGAPCRALARRVEAATLMDKELLVSPALLAELPLPRIAAVSCRPKPGAFANELTRFRFDAILHLDRAPAEPHREALELGASHAPLATLAQHLTRRRSLRVTGLVDDRVAADLAAEDALATAPASAPASTLARLPGPDAVSLEACAELARAHGLELTAQLAPGSRALLLDLDPPTTARSHARPPRSHASAPDPSRHRLASDPLRLARAAILQPALRDHLAARLPEVMVPSTFVFVEALPRLPNGKLDRRRLPPPPEPRPAHTPRPAASSAEPEHDRMMAALASIYAAVGLPDAGPDADFFELGGHSLLAVQIIARIEDGLGVALPLAALFETRTLRGLARRVLDAPRAERQGPPAARLTPERDRATLPLTPMDVSFHYGRLAFGTDQQAWYQVAELERPRLTPAELPRLEAALLHALNLHPMARARISSPDALGRAAHWRIDPPYERLPERAWEIRHTASDAELAALRDHIAHTSFPVDEAPSFRFVLARAPERDHLFVRFNHAAVDGSGLACLLDSVMAHFLGRPEPTLRVLPWSLDELERHHLGATRRPAPGLLGSLRAGLENTELAQLLALLPAPLRARVVGEDEALRALTRWIEVSPWRPGELLPAPIIGEGGEGGDASRGDRRHDPGCARVIVPLPEDGVERLREHARRLRTSLDRLMLAGIVRGASTWNAARTPTGQRPGRVEAYWAVNLRPPRYFRSVVANQFAWARVRAPAPGSEGAWLRELLDPASSLLTRGGLDWLRFAQGFHERDLPAPLRRLLMRAVRRSAASLAVSNTLPLGDLAESPLARAFEVTRLTLHARHGVTDRPVLVLAESEGRLVIRANVPRARFSEEGARRFVLHLFDAMLDLTASLGPAP